jgi:opacity protein-like surface antigen
MKKIVIPVLACVALASSALAGQEIAESKASKEYTAPAEPCFREHEFQLDLFGSWTESDHDNIHRSGWGGGLGLNYFFTRNIGFGVDGNVYDGIRNVDAGEVVWDFSGRVIVRFPIENGETCLAPYLFGGGGILFDSTTVGTFHGGVGIEFRPTHNLGIFTEGRYSWGANDFDAAQVRAGIRIVF